MVFVAPFRPLFLKDTIQAELNETYIVLRQYNFVVSVFPSVYAFMPGRICLSIRRLYNIKGDNHN